MIPYFLVGAERSGTTLLRLMLDAHPLIAWTHEFEYSVEQINSSDRWPEMQSYVDWLGKNWNFLTSGFKIDKNLDYPSLIKSFLIQKRSSKHIVGATCHTHYDRLLRLFPEAKFVYILRDPRDVARSNIAMGWCGNVWRGVDKWLEAVCLWERIKQNIKKEKYLEIKFEQLIRSPEETLSTICKFMGIEYVSSMLSYPEHTTYSMVDDRIIARWKKHMTDKEIELVEYKCKEYMEKGGYELISNNLSGPNFFEKIFLFFQNRLFTIKYRMKKYGIILFISDFLVRKMKIKKFENKYHQKIRNVDLKYIK